MSEEKSLYPPFSVADSSSPSKDGGAMLAAPSNASVSSTASRDALRKVLLKALHDDDDDDSAEDAEVALEILLPLHCRPRSLKNPLYLESAEVITAFGARSELRLALLKYALSQSHKRHADGEPAGSNPPPKQIRKIVHHTDATSRGAYVVHLTRDGVNPVETVKDVYPVIAKNTSTNVTEVWTIARQRPAQVPPGDNPLLAFGEEQDTFPSPEVAEEFVAAHEKQRDDEVKRKEADESRNKERKDKEMNRRHEEETHTPAIQRPDLSKAEMMYALWPRGVPMNDETMALYDACRNAWISVVPRAEAYERHMLSWVKPS